MKAELLEEIINCLPKGKTHFIYFHGAYVVKMLSMLLPAKTNLKAIKSTPFSVLLKQPIIKPLVSSCGDGYIKRSDIECLWQEPRLDFLLSLDRWQAKGFGGWYQSSRTGDNLVLQLNLPHHHIRKFRRWMGNGSTSTLNYEYLSHPVQRIKGNRLFRDTLAWSRIDLDFDYNEALIEEIQSDAVRYITYIREIDSTRDAKSARYREEYLNWFNAYEQNWMQAMLSAAIWFIYEELGINRIYIHTAKSGWQVKHMPEYSKPPASIYSKLPRQFGFKRTWAAPQFLLKTRKYQKLIREQPDIDFYFINMNQFKQ